MRADRCPPHGRSALSSERHSYPSTRGERQGTFLVHAGKTGDPTLDDARKIEFRVHVRDGYAAGIEIYARLRRFDGNLDEPRTAFFSWPSD